jgi:effector-binding domain-containing protein
MSDVVTEKEVPALHTAAIRLATSPQTIGDDLGRAYGDLSTYLSERGLVPLDAPICYYVAWEPENWVIEACLAIGEVIDELGEIHRLLIPGGPAVTTMHLGPYQELGRAHEALAAWCKEHGREMTACYERFITDPAAVADPADYPTEVIWLLAPV